MCFCVGNQKYNDKEPFSTLFFKEQGCVEPQREERFLTLWTHEHHIIFRVYTTLLNKANLL